MKFFARMAVLAVSVLAGSVRVCADAAQSPPVLLTENRARDLGHVFHPTVSSGQLLELLDPLSVLSQTLAAALIIGAFMHRMRKDQVQMESIASMMLKVAFIAILPLSKTWVLESAEAVSGMLGGQAVSGASLVLEETQDRGQLSPLMTRLWALGEQWNLAGSPVGDAVAGNWKAGDGRDEERVAEGWNWAKAPVMEAGTPAEIAWAAESNGRRAELVQRVVMGGAGAVQVCYVAHYLAETFRLLFFHAGCSLAPFCIAGLGVQSLQVQSVRALLGLLGVAFWPLAWAVGNVASHAMLEGALKVSAWTASSAMYPKVASGVERTLAMAAPYLSWWLLSVVVVMTLAVCAWMLGWLALGPWALHRVLSAGARGAGVL